MMKRSLALLLAMVMVLSMLPMSIWAEGQSTAEKNTAYTAPLTQHDHLASGDAHVCEHCVAGTKTGAAAIPEWKPVAANATQLPDKEGHYYLTGNITVKGETLTNTDVVICLNGYTVTAASGERFYTMNEGAKVTVLDCTAKTVTPENENDTGYRAGAMTGATNAAFMLNSTAQLTWYDGILSNNSRSTSYGGAFVIQGTSAVKVYGGQISGNSAKNGGVAFLANNKCSLYAESAYINNNRAENGGVVSIPSWASGVIAFKNCTISGNTATANGGAFYHEGSSYAAGVQLTATGCTFTGNSATATGGVFCGKGGYFTATDCTFTGNSATDHAVISGQGNQVTVTLDGCTLKNNTCAGNNGQDGAVYMSNSTTPLYIQGATYIYDNKNSDSKQANVYLRKENNNPMITIGSAGLKSGALIGITMPNDRLAAQPYASATLNGKLTEQQVAQIFLCDDNKYEAVLDGDRVKIREAGEGHKHCVCGVKGCTAHDQVKCQPWTKTDTMPNENGHWYLTQDLNNVKAAVLDGADVVVCLNGKTVTAKSGERYYTLKNSSKLTIMDCGPYQQEAKTGLLTGATNTGFMFEDNKNNKSELN